MLVRRPLEVTRAEISAFRAKQPRGAHPWTVVETPAGCAIHSSEPGSEATFDFPLAELLSRDGAEAAVLWTEDAALFEYADGRRRDQARSTYDDWLDEHGHTSPEPHALQRAFMRRVLGFAWSSTEYVRENFVHATAHVSRTDAGVEARITPPPLGMVLQVAGLHRGDAELPWSGLSVAWR